MTQTIDNNKESLKKLSILVSQDGLSFFISDSDNNRLTNFSERKFGEKQTPERLLEELKHLLTLEFAGDISFIDELNVIYANELYSLVPQRLFDEKNLSDYLKYNTKILQTDFLAYDELSNLKANLVYIPYANINNYLLDTFGPFNYKHSVAVFLENFKPESTKDEALVYIYQNHFDLCIFQQKKLILCNSFGFQTAEDVAYFLLFTLEQLKINTETVRVKLWGVIEEDSDLYKLLYTYLRHISIPTKEFNQTLFNQKEQEIPVYKHQLLIQGL